MSKQFFGKTFSQVKLKELPSFVGKEIFAHSKQFYRDRFIPSFRAFGWEKELINIHRQRMNIEEAKKVVFRPKGLGIFVGFIVFGTVPSIYQHEKRHRIPLNPHT